MAYFSSIAELAISAGRDANDTTIPTATYFDFVVFLTTFLLIGMQVHAGFFEIVVLTIS